MKQISRSMKLVGVLFLVLVVAISVMERDRQQKLTALTRLDKEIAGVTQRVKTLREREQKLTASLNGLDELEARLLRLEDGAYYRQLLATVVTAGRASGAMLDRLRFAEGQGVGGARAGTISGTVVGSEAEIVAFFRHLEEGRPLAQVGRVNWSIQVTPDKPGGEAGFEVVLFGPIQTP